MSDHQEVSFFRRHRGTIATFGVAIVTGIVIAYILADYELDAQTNEVIDSITRSSVRHNGKATTLIVDDVVHTFISQRAAAEFLGGSDPGISLAISKGRDTYLGATIG